MKKVAIYGTGKVGKAFFESHDFTDEDLVAFVETNATKNTFFDVKVISISDLEENIDVVYLANSYVDTIYMCIQHGVAKDKMVIENEVLCQKYCSAEKKLDIKYDYGFATMYQEELVKPKYVLVQNMDRNLKIYGGTHKEILDTPYIESKDFCRLGTLELIIEQIKENDVKGELAELGVFRGDFSKYLNREFPDRKLYLFDTFSGFDKKDMKEDLASGYARQQWFDEMKNFDDTSVELVLSKMKYPDSVIVRKGYFPNTIPQNEINYALVSIDCDLYAPILAGLRYFYPRLNQGGFIMLHDYNSPECKGVKQAIIYYEREIGQNIIKVPLPDPCGSLIIGK